MQIITLTGRVTGPPRECTVKGRRALAFRVLAENSPLDADCSAAEFHVSSPRLQMRGDLAEGTEVLVTGLLSLSLGLIPCAKVQALVVKVISQSGDSKMEAVMSFLGEGISTDELW